MTIKEDALIKAGLTKNESKVYLALLHLNSATAVDITKRSKVHRVNVYDVLERLQRKGLISAVIKSNKRIYEAADPQQLVKLIKEKEEVLNQVMPSLQQEYFTKKEKQNVYHFLGPEGVMQAYYMMLNKNQTIYGFGGSGLNRKYMKHRHEMVVKEIEKRKTSIKVIYYESTRKNRKKSWKDDRAQIRFMPDKFKTICMVDICGDLVVNLLPIEDNIMAIVIENKVLADTYRQFFNFMWGHAKA